MLWCDEWEREGVHGNKTKQVILVSSGNRLSLLESGSTFCCCCFCYRVSLWLPKDLLSSMNEGQNWMKWMHEWMKWMKEMDEWMDVKNERNGLIGWMNGWNELKLIMNWRSLKERMNEWIGEMDEWLCIFLLICVAAFLSYITFDFFYFVVQKNQQKLSNWKTQ